MALSREAWRKRDGYAGVKRTRADGNSKPFRGEAPSLSHPPPFPDSARDVCRRRRRGGVERNKSFASTLSSKFILDLPRCSWRRPDGSPSEWIVNVLKRNMLVRREVATTRNPCFFPIHLTLPRSLRGEGGCKGGDTPIGAPQDTPTL